MLLAQTAHAGDTVIHLEQSVAWQVGDEITLATTGTRHTQSENEKAVIAAVSDDGFTLTLEVSLG